MTNESGATVKRYIVLFVSMVTSFTVTFMVAAINIAIPTMREQFSLEAWVTAWLGTIYFLSVAAVQVPCGRLADIYGRKKFFIIGLLLTVLASFLGIFASSVLQLFISLALLGVGAGMVLNNSISILTSVFPAEMRGRVLGMNTAGIYTGLSTGPYIGGLLTGAFGWQSVFVVSATLYGLLLVLIIYAIKGEWREAKGERFDIIGSIAYVISVVLFMYGFSSLPDVPGLVFLAVGIAGLVFFARWERRTSSPVFNLSLFSKNKAFLFSNLAVFISYVATFAISFLLSIYLQEIKGLTPDKAGLVIIVATVLMATFTPISGRVSDKIEPRLVASLGMFINCIALFLMIFLNDSTPIWYIVIALAIYGLGNGIFSSPNANAIMGSVAKRSLGIAAGTMGTMRTAGMMVSMGIIMIIFSVYMGDAEIVPAYYPEFLSSVRTDFIILTGMNILGLLCQLAARRVAKQARSG